MLIPVFINSFSSYALINTDYRDPACLCRTSTCGISAKTWSAKKRHDKNGKCCGCFWRQFPCVHPCLWPRLTSMAVDECMRSVWPRPRCAWSHRGWSDRCRRLRASATRETPKYLTRPTRSTHHDPALTFELTASWSSARSSCQERAARPCQSRPVGLRYEAVRAAGIDAGSCCCGAAIDAPSNVSRAIESS